MDKKINYSINCFDRWQGKINRENILTEILNHSRYFIFFRNVYETDELRYKELKSTLDLVFYLSHSLDNGKFLDESFLENQDKTLSVLELFSFRLMNGLDGAKSVLNYQESYLLEQLIRSGEFFLRRLKFSYGIKVDIEQKENLIPSVEVKKVNYLTVIDRFKLLKELISNTTDFHKIYPVKNRYEIVSKVLNIHPQTAKDLINEQYSKGLNDTESNDLLLSLINILKSS
jgi:hypothetical protein